MGQHIWWASQNKFLLCFKFDDDVSMQSDLRYNLCHKLKNGSVPMMQTVKFLYYAT